jgi:hypothetical protein
MTQTDIESNEAHRDRALAKLRKELTKDIDGAAEIARSCGLWEVLRLCYLLRLTRMIMTVPDYRQKLTHADLAGLQMRDEALKYAIALAAKYGRWAGDPSAIQSLSGFKNLRVENLEYYSRHINAKFETEALLHVANVRVMGERDQDCEIDLEAGLEDPRRAMYLEYGFRIERSTMSKKDQLLSVEVLVEQLHLEYAGVADLFEADAGISLDNYCKGMLDLAAALKARGDQAEIIAGVNEHGRIDSTTAKTFMAVARSMYFTDAQLKVALGPEFVAYLRSHPFDGNALSDSELRFHYLSRRPFLMGNGFAIVSPDLVFDSVFQNTHFTLLESEDSKAKYMNRSSEQFLDQVARVAWNAGYQEVARDIYLTQGKQDLGDIDLILHNAKTGHTLLVEGKNHALPLAVYFRSPAALEAHFTRTRSWEKKVQRRIDHLNGGAPSYAVAGRWDYVIVTQMPEPLSHRSHLLVLSVEEFEHWVMQDPRPARFLEFFEALYKPETPTMSMAEMHGLQEEGYVLARPGVKKH